MRHQGFEIIVAMTVIIGVGCNAFLCQIDDFERQVVGNPVDQWAGVPMATGARKERQNIVHLVAAGPVPIWYLFRRKLDLPSDGRANEKSAASIEIWKGSGCFGRDVY